MRILPSAASELQQDFDFIESEADKAYNKYVTEGDNVVIKLDGEEFAGLHEVIRRRVIYRAVYVSYKNCQGYI